MVKFYMRPGSVRATTVNNWRDKIFLLDGSSWTYHVDSGIQAKLDQYAETLTGYDVVEKGYALVMKAHELAAKTLVNLASGVMNEAEWEKTIVSAFKSDYSKKATFIEAVAIALADGVYDSEEKVVIDRLRQAYGFSVEYYEEVKAWLQEFNRIYQVGMKLTK